MDFSVIDGPPDVTVHQEYVEDARLGETGVRGAKRSRFSDACYYITGGAISATLFIDVRW